MLILNDIRFQEQPLLKQMRAETKFDNILIDEAVWLTLFKYLYTLAKKRIVFVGDLFQSLNFLSLGKL